MKQTLIIGMGLLLAIPVILLGKGSTSKVIIEGNGLRAPVTITDAKVLSSFRVWSGPGTSGNETESFVVDWSQGPIPISKKDAQRYTVSFYVQLEPKREQLVYVVFYVYDPLKDQGCLYLPGKGEDWYRLNVSTIVRGVEGHWFRASKSWDNVAKQIARGSNRHE